MALGQIGKKNGLILDGKFKLPKMRYKGPDGTTDALNVRPQCIRKSAQKRAEEEAAGSGGAGRFKISELSSTETEAPALPLRVTPSNSNSAAGTSGRKNSEKSAVGAAVATGPVSGPRGLVTLPLPAWEYEGKPVRAFSCRFDMPRDLAEGLDADQISIQVVSAPAELHVAIPGCVSFKTQMPFHAAEGQETTAELQIEGGKATATLRLTFALRPVDDVFAELKGRAPIPLGSLQLSSFAGMDELA